MVGSPTSPAFRTMTRDALALDVDPTSARHTLPLRIALFNESGLLREGISAVLARHQDEVRLVDCRRGDLPLDVLLIDPWQSRVTTSEQLAKLRTVLRPRRIVCFSWKRTQEAMLATAGLGFDQFLPKNIAPEQLVDALTRLHPVPTAEGLSTLSTVSDAASGTDARDLVEETAPDGVDGVDADEAVSDGGLSTLSTREREVIRLVMEGISNDEIGARLFLSKNTVKSYIRNAYRKMGVNRRSQAVRWGYEHMPPR